ncbi:hypothetical protein SAMN06296058_1584 [Pseudoxanthomonas indica]|uniref:Uncharacterized protein n=3 Tax=Pseudoxanthomonas indica TaxID=428993 RepID=A0A1T5KD04_9GAMM|nr:hypothetical protein SAMN06296058_1584 [Pseudoxanthomonas indica]
MLAPLQSEAHMDAHLPIWPQHEVFYIESMLFHTRKACSSMDYIADLIERIDRHQADGGTLAFDCSIALDHGQSIVLCAAAVSRYFWPVRKAHAPRGAYLKRVFKVEDGSPLRDRSLRDAAEHFDERLDNHLAGSIVGVILPEWFGPTHRSDAPTHYFRAYFIDSGKFRILDDEFEIQAMSDELVRIHNQLLSHVDGGGRFPGTSA